MHNKRLMNPNGGKRVMPCGKFLPGKFTFSQYYKNKANTYKSRARLTDKE